MARNRGRESNVGLIVTLVFFILISVGLGVSTYYGFAQQTDLTAKAAASDAAKKDSDKKADWYQFQALTYRTYLGQTESMDQPADPKDKNSLTGDATLKLLRDQFDTGQLGKDGKGQDFPDKPVVTKLIQTVESKKYKIAKEDPKTKVLALQDVPMTWDKDKKRPGITYEDVYKGQLALADYFEKQWEAAAKAKDEADAAKKKAEDEKGAAQTSYATEVAKLTKQNNDDLKAERDANANLRNMLDTANKEKADAIQKGEDDKKKIQQTVVAREATVKELQGRLTDLQERLAAATRATQETPTGDRPIPTDWKIVRMDRSGKQPFINLGTGDNVKAGMTFSIHGPGPDGKPLPASKGTLEVLNVTDEHLSQAQVLSVKDAFKDPILPGDYLYNPIFRPSGEQHVVIAGRIDMHGTKGDDFEEFQRLLQRQNVVVDGYVDPKDGTLKGKLSVGTDYLVLGSQEGLPDAAAANVKSLQEQARNSGVHIVGAREFLESMGYRAP